MTAAKGFVNSKKAVSIATVSLFAAGALIALLLLYQNFTTKPDSISKQDAINIALAEVDNEPDRSAHLLPNKRAEAKLVHVTEGGMAFLVDENSMADLWLYGTDKFNAEYGNRYFWHVNVATSSDEGGSRGYWYLIDATSGQVIANDKSTDMYAVI